MPMCVRISRCGVKVAPYDSVEKFLEKIKDATVLLDPNKTSDTIARSLLNCGTVYAQSPVALLKAVKNDVQIEGTRKAMERDGVALVKLFMWIEQNVASGSITEYDVAQKVQEFRAASPLLPRRKLRSYSRLQRAWRHRAL